MNTHHLREGLVQRDGLEAGERRGERVLPKTEACFLPGPLSWPWTGSQGEEGHCALVSSQGSRQDSPTLSVPAPGRPEPLHAAPMVSGGSEMPGRGARWAQQRAWAPLSRAALGRLHC